jgi:hypothetical protein
MPGESRSGGGYEAEHKTPAGAGMCITGRCDECGQDGHASRRRAKVAAGKLRGLHGMVCVHCLAKRTKGVAA